MFLLIPRKKGSAPRPGIFQGAKAIGEIGSILEGFEVGFRIGIVITDMGSGVTLDHPQIDPQFTHRLGDHGTTPVGMEGQLIGGNALTLTAGAFIADNYAPFYSTPIECTDRDVAFVLDGLFYNESDLDLEEHYTDTHGYTEINFAAFGLLGRCFCPRIRGVQQQRIYRLDPDRDYGGLASLVGRTDRTLDTRLMVEQWDRMGQFYASLETGHTTASVALKRLAGYTAQNRFYRANRDLGRIFKTEFILHYMTQPQLHARIRRSLLKIEQLHALARDVYSGRRGRINARELHEQLNACSCLTLILACIIYWQAREIARVLSQYRPEEDGIDPVLLEHISPIEWDNVVLYGEYIINRKLIH